MALAAAAALAVLALLSTTVTLAGHCTTTYGGGLVSRNFYQAALEDAEALRTALSLAGQPGFGMRMRRVLDGEGNSAEAPAPSETTAGALAAAEELRSLQAKVAQLEGDLRQAAADAATPAAAAVAAAAADDSANATGSNATVHVELPTILSLGVTDWESAVAEEPLKLNTAPPITLPSTWSIYRVENKFCCLQLLAVVDTMCFNGTHALTMDEECANDNSAAAPGGPLELLRCSFLEDKSWKHHVSDYPRLAFLNHMCRVTLARQALMRLFALWLLPPLSPLLQRQQLKKESEMQFGGRPMSWFASRAAITWRRGTTYLQYLDTSSVNVAHIYGKLAQMLLVNNATEPALALPVHRVALPRAHLTLMRLRHLGTTGWHATFIRQLAILVMRQQLGPRFERHSEMEPHLVLGDKPMAWNTVEFEEAFDAATEDQPLCFERVIMPGVLKATMYPGGPSVAKKFQRELRRSLTPQPQITIGEIMVLYITRLDQKVSAGRRMFTAESHEALLGLFAKLGFRVRMVEFQGMPFMAQFRAVQEADIFVSLHGAGLLNAAALARGASVLLEIMPYKTLHGTFHHMTVNTGLTYMMHQCHAGATRAGDARYAHLSVKSCMGTGECKGYFTHFREIELTEPDLQSLERMLALAAEIVEAAKVNEQVAGARLLGKYPDICQSEGISYGCRNSFMQSYLADVNRVCVLEQDSCSAIAPSTSLSLQSPAKAGN
eukprot:SM000293S10923  [mRNA]  locus=s293:89535:93369:- [translate_table: standard]